ncbi:lamin tail domain-containing protein [Actinacidiphila paucisporea]|uniref:Lamin Tail Domain n=1 Tax=Actinacidiphila paucisporea TaxID=310782 RepID=A0A1M7QXZ7_9ACTN|nr:lamin tail domain-containing protein [Actinacidiphila paucisporea]SHN36929.1 Lamin Tail Domain [Actinacidiphila paucisporea]
MSRTAFRLTASALVAGAALAAAALPAAAADHGQRHEQRHDQRHDQGYEQRHDQRHEQGHEQGHEQRPQVVLGQVQYAASGRSHRRLNEQWVTVTNTSRRPVSLDRWTLSDSDHHTYRFDDVTLDGHQSVRVHAGSGRDTDRDLYQGSRSSVWDASDTATLRDNRGRLVDTESWGRAHR